MPPEVAKLQATEQEYNLQQLALGVDHPNSTAWLREPILPAPELEPEGPCTSPEEELVQKDMDKITASDDFKKVAEGTSPNLQAYLAARCLDRVQTARKASTAFSVDLKGLLGFLKDAHDRGIDGLIAQEAARVWKKFPGSKAGAKWLATYGNPQTLGDHEAKYVPLHWGTDRDTKLHAYDMGHKLPFTDALWEILELGLQSEDKDECHQCVTLCLALGLLDNPDDPHLPAMDKVLEKAQQLRALTAAAAVQALYDVGVIPDRGPQALLDILKMAHDAVSKHHDRDVRSWAAFPPEDIQDKKIFILKIPLEGNPELEIILGTRAGPKAKEIWFTIYDFPHALRQGHEIPT